MVTQFSCPSPRGTNNAGLYLTKAGTLVDRHGRNWGASSMRRMAQDAALTPAFGAEREWTPMDHQAAHLRRAVHDALGEACKAHGLNDQVHKALSDLVDQHLKGESDADKGMGALDDESELDGKIREYLSGHGLADDDVEKAIEIARKDRAAAAVSDDELPSNRFGNGPPIKQRLETDAELEKKYPGFSNTTADIYGEPVSRRHEREADEVRREGERLGSRLPSGGVTRRLSNNSAFDAELTALIENVKVGVWG